VWPFSLINHFKQYSSDIALVQADRQEVVSFADLSRLVSHRAELMANLLPRTLVLLYPLAGEIEPILLYLACLELGYPVCLLEPRIDLLSTFVSSYQPGLVLLPSSVWNELLTRTGQSYIFSRYVREVGNGYCACFKVGGRVGVDGLHKDLNLLLTTSGSTGSPKLVRLSGSNLISNAWAIAEYLAIGSGQRCVQTLPFHYSYGLSLINSHLFSGAAVVLTGHSFMRPEFWRVVADEKCTSFAGVPYMYETLYRLRFDPAVHSSLKTYTQAGGALKPDLIRHYGEKIHKGRSRFFIMYGQTEATARISYVPPDMLMNKIGSIGVAVPGGELALEGEAGISELVYRGPNVMMGYSEGYRCLAKGDELDGVLRTGDLATVDDDGFFSITGRIKRIAKLFGQRVNLQDVELEVEKLAGTSVAVVAPDGELFIAVVNNHEHSAKVDLNELKKSIAHFLQIPPRCVRVIYCDRLPLTASGKCDYQKVLSFFNG
jgi:acyl-CoA synthetase (AMP-forming)/AMP-acid ligase II